MQHRKQFIPVFAVAAAGFALPASAEFKYENQSGGSVEFYGQFSPSYLWADDGDKTTNKFVDNDSSNSRVGLRITQPFASGTLGFNLEAAVGLRLSDDLSQVYTPDSFDWDREQLRRIDFSFDTPTWGKFYIGQGSMATDGITEMDFNNNGMTTYVSITDTMGGILFREKNGTLSDIAIGDAADSLDGGRRARVRYDTPEFSGFTLSAAAGKEVLSYSNNDKYYDAALKYNGEFQGFKLQAGVGYSYRDTEHGANIKDTIGSLAVLHEATGINVALAAGSRQHGGDYYYGKLGYDKNIWSIGMTSFAVDYYKGSDFVVHGSDTDVYGLGINQNIDSLNAQVYVGYRNSDFKHSGKNYHDVDSYIIGARWTF